MVLILDDRLNDITDWTLERISAIERLAQCAFDGFHIIVATSPKVIAHLMSLPLGTFSAVAIAMLKQLQSNYAFQGALLNSGLSKLTITTSDAIRELPEGAFGSLSIDALKQISLEPTILLAENVVDAKIFRFAARHYIASQRLRGIDVAAIERGGGGSQIAPEFEEIVNASRVFCIAVTDSDRNCAECGQSDTSKKCEKLAARAPNLSAHIELPVRELENIVPACLLEDLVADQHIDAARTIQRVFFEFPDIRLYGDIKDGVNGERIFRLQQGSPQRAFLLPVVKFLTRVENYCIRVEDCHGARNQKGCSCIAIPKIGGIGDAFHEWLSSQSPQKALERFVDPWRTNWLSVGKQVLNWCCAPSPRRS